MTGRRLRDGVVFVAGAERQRLLDFSGGKDIALETSQAAVIEALLLGEALTDAELDVYVRRGLVVTGEGGADRVLYDRLARLEGAYCERFIGSWPKPAREAHRAVLTAHAHRKRFWEQVAQCAVLPETAVRRALLVGAAAEVGRKRILCLGDDDLVSVALLALGHDVTVLDLDPHLLALLCAATAELGLTVTTHEYDAREPVPAHLGRFDCALTDPVSSRDCLELFLSRAVALAHEGAPVHVAVFAPASGLFLDITRQMGLPVESWRRRFNRYYSGELTLHEYESDWVTVTAGPGARPRYPASEAALPQNLYREDCDTRPPLYLLAVRELEQVRYARPMFLDLLVDILRQEGGLHLGAPHVELGQDYTVVHGRVPGGYFLLHVDRARRELHVRLHPLQPGVEKRLRELVVMAYKASGVRFHTSISRLGWDERLS